MGKMPVLNWIGKDKIVDHDKELPFRVLKPNKKLSSGESGNLLIHGDNLEALKALMPFYYGKVDCVYIDPPYNTGNEGWIYNDRVNSPQIKSWLNKTVGAEGEDLCRHDKWLCMMYPRLKLLKDLLGEDGFIFASIDDNEQHNLRLVLNEIFGEQNFIANIIWQKKYTQSNDAKYLSDTHDFIVCYAKNKLHPTSKIKLLERTSEQVARFKNPDNDPRGPWMSQPIQVKTPSDAYIYEIENPVGKTFLPPKGRSWQFSKDKYLELVEDKRIWFGHGGTNVPRIKKFLNEVKEGVVPRTLWLFSEVGSNDDAKRELRKILPEKTFDSPKPVSLIKRILRIATDEDSIILDSFAGSGTTGQAVLELNKEDGGNRKFLLVELEKEIAEKVTAQRLKKVIGGYEGAAFPKGTDQGFEYLDLNGELFNKDGYINEKAAYVDLASYIYYTETKNYTELSTIKSPFVGKLGNTNYYLVFNELRENVLNEKLFSELKAVTGSKVVFADKTLIDEEDLQKHNITFKQIPYELKKF